MKQENLALSVSFCESVGDAGFGGTGGWTGRASFPTSAILGLLSTSPPCMKRTLRDILEVLFPADLNMGTVFRKYSVLPAQSHSVTATSGEGSISLGIKSLKLLEATGQFPAFPILLQWLLPCLELYRAGAVSPGLLCCWTGPSPK